MVIEYNKPLPVPSQDSQEFWDGCKRHELVFQRCSKCGKFRNPASFVCPDCLSEDYSWEKVSGKGRVFTFIVVHQLYHQGFASEVPYNVSVIELEEGIRMVSNIVGIDNGEIQCDMPVQAVFEDVADGVTIPKFKPA